MNTDQNFYKQFEGKHNFLGNLLLEPTVNSTDSNRSQMFSSHLEQCIQIDEGEPPLLFTRFENEVGKYSTGYKKLEGKFRVIKKIRKNDYCYAMIIQNKKTSEFDVVFRNECKWLTEKYGYRYNNEVIDSLEEDDIIEDEVIYKNKNYDEENNFQYGKNLNTVFLTFGGLTNEDGIVISQSTAEKLAISLVEKIRIPLNTNDILTNRLGNNNFYKCFKDIGEKVEDGILASSRRIKYEDIVNSLKNMQKYYYGDSEYSCNNNGIIVDIDVFCNIDNDKIDEVLNQTYNKQIYKYYKQNMNYYRNFVNFLEPIVEGKGKGKNKKKYKISRNLLHYYNRFKSFIDPNVKFSTDGNLFDHLILEFTVLSRKALEPGNKITGRYGRNKLFWFN